MSFFNIPIIQFLLFGNFFVGICAVGLSIETSYRQNLALNPIYYYLLVFSGTALYYTKAFLHKSSGYPDNERDQWYSKNKKLTLFTQFFFIGILLICGILFFASNSNKISELNSIQLFMLLLFPFVALLYYGINSKLNIRKYGQLKPFLIGFAWAGIVTIYPIIFQSLGDESSFKLSQNRVLLFIENFIFISVLCIMFDIKDFKEDSVFQLKTYAVSQGIKKTIYFIIIPLSVIGIITNILFVILNHYPLIQALSINIPLLLGIYFSFKLLKHKRILYYLFFIDGLMLVKSLCGIAASQFN
ncbi:MAG: hypothetical protein IPM51_08880 [Sphingobacteriaceae bacterium]|nr:hypothetical protein [Sphingobacteriaceae bacterium]